MSHLVDPTRIEAIVDARRDLYRHHARVTTEDVVYILHSKWCVAFTPDLRECPYSLALDRGLTDVPEWAEVGHRPTQVFLRAGRLVPVVS